MTIGGASAGGASVDLQLSAYGGRDDGLFHAAAAESQSFGAQLTVEESQYQYDALVNRVGCKNTPDTLACLRSLDTIVIVENNSIEPTPGGAGGDPNYMYSNTIDGDFTPDYTYNLFAEGKFVKVPVIFGCVSLFKMDSGTIQMKGQFSRHCRSVTIQKWMNSLKITGSSLMKSSWQKLTSFTQKQSNIQRRAPTGVQQRMPMERCDISVQEFSSAVYFHSMGC